MATITSDLASNLMVSAVALTALTIMSLAALRGWRDWIQLKREELAAFLEDLERQATKFEEMRDRSLARERAKAEARAS